jgi:hypothetical protein
MRWTYDDVLDLPVAVYEVLVDELNREASEFLAVTDVDDLR